jgi:hypothetical protein
MINTVKTLSSSLVKCTVACHYLCSFYYVVGHQNHSLLSTTRGLIDQHFPISSASLLSSASNNHHFTFKVLKQLFQILHQCWDHTLSFCTWYNPLNIMMSVSCMLSQMIALIHFHNWIVYHCVYVPYITYASVGGHLGFFHFWLLAMCYRKHGNIDFSSTY